MPLYEYQCVKCGEKFEKLTSFSDVPRCPNCGAAETEKLVTCCARFKASDGDWSSPAMPAASGGCGGCSGGNCASCGR